MLTKTLFPGVAVVTGAGGTGIGAAVAKAFAAAGCERIAITDLDETTLDQTRRAVTTAQPHAQVLAHPGNVADEHFVDTFTEKVVRYFGRVDYAVNCAGVLGRPQRSAEISLAE